MSKTSITIVTRKKKNQTDDLSHWKLARVDGGNKKDVHVQSESFSTKNTSRKPEMLILGNPSPEVEHGLALTIWITSTFFREAGLPCSVSVCVSLGGERCGARHCTWWYLLLLCGTGAMMAQSKGQTREKSIKLIYREMLYTAPPLSLISFLALYTPHLNIRFGGQGGWWTCYSYQLFLAFSLTEIDSPTKLTGPVSALYSFRSESHQLVVLVNGSRPSICTPVLGDADLFMKEGPLYFSS